MTEKKGRGFAGMDRAKQRAIASKGGKAAHQKGTAHEFTPEEARIDDRKGGQAAKQKGRAHEFTAEEARAAGRKGGQAAHDKNRMRQFPGGEGTPGPAPRTEEAPAEIFPEPVQCPTNGMRGEMTDQFALKA